jgi:hypothetical protein
MQQITVTQQIAVILQEMVCLDHHLWQKTVALEELVAGSTAFQSFCEVTAVFCAPM